MTGEFRRLFSQIITACFLYQTYCPWGVTAVYCNRACHLLQNLLKPLYGEKTGKCDGRLKWREESRQQFAPVTISPALFSFYRNGFNRVELHSEAQSGQCLALLDPCLHPVSFDFELLLPESNAFPLSKRFVLNPVNSKERNDYFSPSFFCFFVSYSHISLKKPE